MARWLESPLPHYTSNFSIHDILTIVFAVVSVAVILSIVSSLCSSCHKRPKTPKSPSPNKTSPLNHNPNPNPNPNSDFAEATAQVLELTNSTPPQREERTVIGITPDVATHGPIPPTVLPSSSSVSSSKRRLSISLSTRLPDMMRMSRKEQKQLDAGEDTIWKKTIILGERCRVPSDDEEEGGVKNYRPRTPRSRPISRTNSFANHDVAPARMSSFSQQDLNPERRGE
ncbi:hypothetical protein LUZ60_013858 [Juncus effusus]|nr:hypothetical protein LUZ60_013858 [Juncus effusus]